MGKAPAFQFYANDFLQGTSDFSLEERGAYVTWLCQSWDKGPLPLPEQKRATMIGATLPRFRKIWETVGAKWIVTDAGFVNARLEQARSDRDEYAAVQSGRAKKRWDARAHAAAYATAMPERMPEPCSSFFDLQSSDPLHGTERHEEAATAVCVFPTVGRPSLWTLHQWQIDEWAGLYPNLDVPTQMRHALAWVKANPSKRKTARGMQKFLVSWMTRSVDSAPARSNGHVPHVPRPMAEIVDWQAECRQLHQGRCGNAHFHDAQMFADRGKAS